MSILPVYASVAAREQAAALGIPVIEVAVEQALRDGRPLRDRGDASTDSTLAVLDLDDRTSVELAVVRSGQTGRRVWRALGVRRSQRPVQPSERHRLRSVEEAIGDDEAERVRVAVEEPS